MIGVEKLKRDGVPIGVFSLIVATKVYSLWAYVSGNPQVWQLLGDIGQLGTYGRAAPYYLTRELSYLLYFVTAVAFDALVLYSFIVRGEARSRPEGPWENVFPIVTVVVPVAGFTLLLIPQVRDVLPGFSPETHAWLASITPHYGFYLTMAGFAIGFAGAAMSIWALSHLKRSFGLRAAVRTLVTDGPYARIRHPLYMAEIVHITGIALLSAIPAGLWLLLVAVALQAVRAKIEERKFLRELPEYAAYQARTGFLWPRLRRPSDRSGPSPT